MNTTNKKKVQRVFELRNEEIGNVKVAIQPDSGSQRGKVILLASLNKSEINETFSSDFNHYANSAQALYNVQFLIKKIMDEIDRKAGEFYLKEEKSGV